MRPGPDGQCVQLALLSTRGNSLEAVTFDPAQIPALIGALEQAKEVAERDLMAALDRRKAEAAQSYKDALARNPWLNGEKQVKPDDTYIVRPR